MKMRPNLRSAVDAGLTLCLHIGCHCPGATDSDCWAD